jgi:signal transduction histidine kinase
LEHGGSDKNQVENLEQILSSLRHEIGNSINSLKITLDVLRENYDRFDDEKKKDYLKRGSDLIARQMKLVEAMKSYTRFDVTEQEEIPFQSLWDQFLTTWSSKLRDNHIRFIQNLEIDPCLVMGNSDAIQQVLSHILDNAVESLDGNEDPFIEIRATVDNGFVVLIVKDNGSGIETKDMQRVFTPLFGTKPGKMGMGLPIARRLLSKMDGRIEIYSSAAEGTEAAIWLRMARYREKRS